MIDIKIDAKQATDDIRMAFRDLSEREFGKAVFLAINETIKRGKSMIGKGVKKDYPNLKITRGSINKGLPLKNASQRKWVGQVLISKDKIKFKHWSYTMREGIGERGKGGSRTRFPSGVVIEIKKGQKKFVKNVFIPKKASLNAHLYAKGDYRGNKFVPSEARNGRLSTMLGLGLNNTFQNINQPLVKEVKADLEKEYPRRLTRILKSMADGTFAKRGKRVAGLIS